ncbi:MAG: FHA domain-containing protein [Blautia sp.]|nr:FHA domain-containing protein [Blautia sp.]
MLECEQVFDQGRKGGAMEKRPVCSGKKKEYAVLRKFFIIASAAFFCILRSWTCQGKAEIIEYNILGGYQDSGQQNSPDNIPEKNQDILQAGDRETEEDMAGSQVLYVRGAGNSEKEYTVRLKDMKTGRTTALRGQEILDRGYLKENVYTLLLVDNDADIPQENREKLREILEGILDAHLEGERFAFYTFREGKLSRINTFSDLYRFLEISVRNLSFEEQESVLSDALLECMGELDTENRLRFCRIVVVSGGDSQEAEIFRELGNFLEVHPMPFYCVEQERGKTPFQALCRQNGGKWFSLEKTDASEVVQWITKDRNLRVLQVFLPPELQSGRTVTLQLEGKNGVGTWSAEREMRLPLSPGYREPQPSPEPTASPVPSRKPSPTEIPVERAASVSERSPEALSDKKEKKAFPMAFALLAFAGCAFMGGSVFFYFHERSLPGKKNRFLPENGEPASDCSSEKEIPCMAVLRSLQHPERTWRIPCRAQLVIGKHSRYADLAITGDHTISRRHLKVEMEGGNLYMEDLDSRNGTWHNHHKMSGREVIKNNDLLRIGDSEFIVLLPGEQEETGRAGEKQIWE